ncbi:sigma 54-interacting transcriptional regulator [Marinobacterium sp. YM272]|uniref:sigma 54-interacting transcriptional regulator n=1 Tax=Marinobacterium sp. YM272 TaxID=3421654 RepID=UPI003D7FD2AD
MSEKRLIEHFNLRSKLKFDIDNGHIWFGENRMLLLHTQALSGLRDELFANLGQSRARGLLIRMGFRAGQMDAEVATQLYGAGDDYDVFKIGPELHAFEGNVKAEITQADIDWEQGSFDGRVHMEHSWEAEAHIQQYGIGDDVGCWTLVGYASGYVSTFFKRFIVFREIECACKGDSHCTVIGKPAEDWNDDAYIDLFRIDQKVPPVCDIEQQLHQLRGSRPSTAQLEQGNLVGQSPGFLKAFDLLHKASRGPINVLLLGETGVGKEVFAKWLHENSDRADKPFVAINCAAIPNDLIEAELFGVRRGAYTGAQESRPGRFERADGGTLFLDEVGDLSLSAQVKLLRALQSGEVERLGDNEARKVNVRLIAATNLDLERAIAEGKFRADLFYRIATYPVEIPPLRERKSDVPLLAKAMLKKYAPVYGRPEPGLTDGATQALMEYSWPGNIRQLENLIERALLLVPEGGKIEIGHLFPGNSEQALGGANLDNRGRLCKQDESRMNALYDTLISSADGLETHLNRIYQLAIERAGGNLAEAARMLGVTRRQVAYRVQKEGETEGEA